MNTAKKIITLVVILTVIVAFSFLINSFLNKSANKNVNGQITFNEMGLPSGVNWSIELKANDYSSTYTTDNASVAFSNLRNEAYNYYVSQESGYCLKQSGQTNGNGYSGSLYLGKYDNISYPTDLTVNLTFVPVTPRVSSFSFVNTSSKGNTSYSLSFASVSGKLSLVYIQLDIQNVKNELFSMLLGNATNKFTILNGTWNITVTGGSYLSVATSIEIKEVNRIPTFDPFLAGIKIIDTQTGGVIVPFTAPP